MATDVTGTDKGQRCPAWMKLLLVTSLAANLVVVGLFAGQMMKKKERVAGAGRQIEWILKLVPNERRDFTKTHFSAIREPMRQSHRARREHMVRIVSAIRAEPFVAEELNKALVVRRDASIMRRALVQDRLVALLDEFTAAERTKFADNLDMYLEKWRKRQRSRRQE